MIEKSAYKKCPPAFQFYASDTLANINFRSMSFSERGLYITLLSELWVNTSLPADEEKLAVILGKDVEVIGENLSDLVLDFFEITKGNITSPDLIAYRNKLDEIRRKQIIGGKKGQALKKNKARSSEGIPIGLRVEENGVEENGVEENREEESLYSKEDKAWLASYGEIT